MKKFMIGISERSDFQIIARKIILMNQKEMEVDQDHIHIMKESIPKLSPLQIIHRLKHESTYRIWQKHPELQKYFWKEKTFWSDGYFCCSIGNASIDTVRQYIELQG